MNNYKDKWKNIKNKLMNKMIEIYKKKYKWMNKNY